MTVTNTFTDSELYTGNGVTTAFSTRFLYAAKSEVLVYKITIATGVETLQEITTHYTLSAAGTGSPGTVTMLIAPTSAFYIKIVRETPRTQTTDYVEATKFPAATHEAALDKLTRLIQEMSRDIGRSPQLPLSSINYPTEFPDWGPSTAGYIVAVNDTGTALELVIPIDVTGLLPIDNGFVGSDSSQFLVRTAEESRTALGLGTMALQAASSVAITGGTIDGVDISSSDITGATITGGTATGVAISGGTIDGTTLTNVILSSGTIQQDYGMQIAMSRVLYYS